VLTAKRSTIIAAIKEVETAQEEDVWLSAYEADDQRYKVWREGGFKSGLQGKGGTGGGGNAAVANHC